MDEKGGTKHQPHNRKDELKIHCICIDASVSNEESKTNNNKKTHTEWDVSQKSVAKVYREMGRRFDDIPRGVSGQDSGGKN